MGALCIALCTSRSLGIVWPFLRAMDPRKLSLESGQSTLGPLRLLMWEGRVFENAVLSQILPLNILYWGYISLSHINPCIM